MCVWMLAWTLMGVGVGGDTCLDIHRCVCGEGALASTPSCVCVCVCGRSPGHSRVCVWGDCSPGHSRVLVGGCLPEHSLVCGWGMLTWILMGVCGCGHSPGHSRVCVCVCRGDARLHTLVCGALASTLTGVCVVGTLAWILTGVCVGVDAFLDTHRCVCVGGTLACWCVCVCVCVVGTLVCWPGCGTVGGGKAQGK